MIKKKIPTALDKLLGLHYTKKLKVSEIAFIVSTQMDVKKITDYRYLGMPLSGANLELIVDHKETDGYKNWFAGQRKMQRAMETIKDANKPLRPLIKLQEDLKKVTDKWRKPINMGIGSLPNPFGTTYPQPNYDDDGDIISNIQPVGHKRRPTTGVGITGYMTTRKLDNPVEISKAWLKDFGLTITGFKNIKYLCKEMNVTSGEAFKYICEGINKNPKRYRHHRITMEMFRGSLAVVDLIDFYNSKRAEHRSKNKYKFTQEQLYRSQEFKDFCKLHGIEFATFKTFHAWWLEINKLHKAEAKKRPQGLLS